MAHLRRNAEAVKDAAQAIEQVLAGLVGVRVRVSSKPNPTRNPNPNHHPHPNQVLADLPRSSRQASNPATAQGQLVDQWQNKLRQAAMLT